MGARRDLLISTPRFGREKAGPSLAAIPQGPRTDVECSGD